MLARSPDLSPEIAQAVERERKQRMDAIAELQAEIAALKRAIATRARSKHNGGAEAEGAESAATTLTA